MTCILIAYLACSCSKVGETIKRLETRIRKHNDAYEKEAIEKFAVAEHAWTN